jgi:hypothetical protein
LSLARAHHDPWEGNTWGYLSQMSGVAAGFADVVIGAGEMTLQFSNGWRERVKQNKPHEITKSVS